MHERLYHRLLGVQPGASAQAADAAYRAAHGHSTPALRRAWRVLRDPFYAATYATFGEQALDDAGFVDDGALADTVGDDGRLSVTPTHKLAGGGAVLLSTGAFSPLHAGHLEMMDRARGLLQARGITVAGGYLSPSHDAYVSVKRDGQAKLSGSHRLALCDLAVADSDWLMVDPWEARYTAAAVNFTDVVAHLQRALDNAAPGRYQVVYVFGADNAAFARAFVGAGACVCVGRDGHQQAAARVAADPAIAAAAARIVFDDGLGQYAGVSSLGVRDGDSGALPRRMRAQAARWIAPSVGGMQDPRWYALRDDRAWAASRWSGHDLDAPLDRFACGAAQAITDAFLAAQAPDRPRRVRVRLLDVAAQDAYLRALPGPLLSFDACTAADHHLRLSRRFGCCDGQVRAHGLDGRPGTPTLAAQAAAVAPGMYTLVDDDIASGFTMAQVTAALPEGVKVRAEVSLLRDVPPTQETDDPLDVVDLRDLLLGARDGGLVVELPGGLARAPYALPYVNPHTRAKVPPSAAMSFSVAVWHLNLDFHNASGLRVAHADPACRELAHRAGFADDATLADVCAWHLDRLTHLPFRLPDAAAALAA